MPVQVQIVCSLFCFALEILVSGPSVQISASDSDSMQKISIKQHILSFWDAPGAEISLKAASELNMFFVVFVFKYCLLGQFGTISRSDSNSARDY